MSLLLWNFIFLFYITNYSAAKICANRHMGIYSDYFLEVASVKENKKGMYKWSSCSFYLLNYFQDSAGLSSFIFLYSLINPNGVSLQVKKGWSFFDQEYMNSSAPLLEPQNKFPRSICIIWTFFFSLLITVIKLFLEMLTQFTLPLV